MAEQTTIRGFRYRLYPTPAQEELFGQYSGVCRLVYNLGLEQRRDFWRSYLRTQGRHITYFSQTSELTQLRAAFDWIAAVPFQATAYALRDLDRAYANFFAGRAKYPRPRSRREGHGFRLGGQVTATRQLNAKRAEVRIQKVGWVRFRMTRPIHGRVRNLSVSCTAGQWHVSFTAEHVGEVATSLTEAVGLDLGVARTVTLSTGEHYQAPNDLAGMTRARRRLSRGKKGSARRNVQKRRLAQLQAKAARRRADWAHKVSTSAANRFGVVVAEDLDIRAMTRSAHLEGAAQKRGLNRSILTQAWGILTTQLAYKLAERGGRLIFVDPKHTSQTCAACGVVDRRSRESQARFLCVHCGHEDNADVNAAKEILRRGTAWLDVEADVGRPSKRQLEEARHV